MISEIPEPAEQEDIFVPQPARDIPLIRTEKNVPAPRERYFVPPKPVNVPQPEQEDTLVSRMQALCARIFGKR